MPDCREMESGIFSVDNENSGILFCGKLKKPSGKKEKKHESYDTPQRV